MANALNAAVKERQSRNLSFRELDKALGRYQASRLPRMLKISKSSMDVCRIQGVDSVKYPLFVASYWLKSTPWVDMQEAMVRGTKTLDFLPAPKGFVRTTKQSHRHSNVLAMIIGLIWGCGIGHFVASGLWVPKLRLLG